MEGKREEGIEKGSEKRREREEKGREMEGKRKGRDGKKGKGKGKKRKRVKGGNALLSSFGKGERKDLIFFPRGKKLKWGRGSERGRDGKSERKAGKGKGRKIKPPLPLHFPFSLPFSPKEENQAFPPFTLAFSLPFSLFPFIPN